MTFRGKQRVRSDGQVETLAEIPITAWIPTEDVDVAYGMLGKHLEEQLGGVDWDDEPETEHVRSTAAAIRRLEAQ